MSDDHGYPPMTADERALFARVGTAAQTDADLTRLREWVAEVRYVDPSLAARIDAKLMVTERCSECRYVGLLDGHLPPSNTCPNTGKVAKRERV